MTISRLQMTTTKWKSKKHDLLRLPKGYDTWHYDGYDRKPVLPLLQMNYLDILAGDHCEGARMIC